jgi:inorganic triphosphatase YgiF
MTTEVEPEEVELKFALPRTTVADLEKLLTRSPVLARRKAVHVQLHNVYFDTSDQLLRRSKIALRVRQIAGDLSAEWVQTLKMGAGTGAVLNRRGEWETAVSHEKLEFEALQKTPWIDFDPTGIVFEALEPVFTTAFRRTIWIVKRRDGSSVEVALDIGEVRGDGRTAPICELELELLSGAPQALFSIAGELATSISLLPLAISKSERGYRLAQGTLLEPHRSQPRNLDTRMSLPTVACAVLVETFVHFTSNLIAVRDSDDPEVLHQARVGWRRFKSALKLFKKSPFAIQPPATERLKPLLGHLATMREIDVCMSETLPMLANAYTAGDSDRKLRWQAMEQSLNQARLEQRAQLLAALHDPALGATLIEMSHWLHSTADEGLSEEEDDTDHPPAGAWAQRRVSRLYDQLKEQAAASDDPEIQHRVRILSKRLRYGVDSLRTLLPKRRAKRWHQTAERLQTEIGAARDLLQAVGIVAGLRADDGLVEFLRGVSAGERMRRE